MLQAQSTAFPRHQKKEAWGTNTDKTNATYEIINKEVLQQRKVTGWEASTSFTQAEPHP